MAIAGCVRKETDQEEGQRVRLRQVAWIRVDTQGGPMATQLRTFGWGTWTLMFVLLILIVAMVYLAF